MDYKEFMSYLDASGTSHKDAISGLQNYVHEFPYFQSAQALLAKALREQEHVRFDKQLKIAAAYCGDRKSLEISGLYNDNCLWMNKLNGNYVYSKDDRMLCFNNGSIKIATLK